MSIFAFEMLHSLPKDNVALTKTSLGSESCLQASMGLTRIVPPGGLGKVLDPGKKQYLTTSTCTTFLPTTVMSRWNTKENIFVQKTLELQLLLTLHCFFILFQLAQQWRAKNNLALVTFLDKKIKLIKTEASTCYLTFSKSLLQRR